MMFLPAKVKEILNHPQQASHPGLYAQFLAHLTVKGFCRRFEQLDTPTRYAPELLDLCPVEQDLIALDSYTTHAVMEAGVALAERNHISSQRSQIPNSSSTVLDSLESNTGHYTTVWADTHSASTWARAPDSTPLDYAQFD